MTNKSVKNTEQDLLPQKPKSRLLPVKEARAAVKDLRVQLRTSQINEKRVEKALDASVRDCEFLRGHLEETTASLTATKKQVAVETDKADTLAEELVEQYTLLKETQSRLSMLQDEYETAVKENTQLRAEVERYKGAAEQARQDAFKHQHRASGLAEAIQIMVKEQVSGDY